MSICARTILNEFDSIANQLLPLTDDLEYIQNLTNDICVYAESLRYAKSSSGLTDENLDNFISFLKILNPNSIFTSELYQTGHGNLVWHAFSKAINMKTNERLRIKTENIDFFNFVSASTCRNLFPLYSGAVIDTDRLVDLGCEIYKEMNYDYMSQVKIKKSGLDFVYSAHMIPGTSKVDSWIAFGLTKLNYFNKYANRGIWNPRKLAIFNGNLYTDEEFDNHLRFYIRNMDLMKEHKSLLAISAEDFFDLHF